MSKPVIFTISAAWDDEASVWSGHCDDIPAAADAPTLDELLAKISAIALDLLPDNHPASIRPRYFFRSLHCAKLNRLRRRWRRSSTAPARPAATPGCTLVRQGRAATNLAQPDHQAEFCRAGRHSRVATPPTPFCARRITEGFESRVENYPRPTAPSRERTSRTGRSAGQHDARSCPGSACIVPPAGTALAPPSGVPSAEGVLH